MRIAWLAKRHYTNRDLIDDQFGRLFHLPIELRKLGHEQVVIAADYRSSDVKRSVVGDVEFTSLPLRPGRLVSFARSAYADFKSFRPDVVIASADIHFGLLGKFLAERLKTPFIFDIYDDYSVFASGRILGMRTAFRATLRRADLLISASVPLASKLRTLNKAVTVIENGVDVALFKPLDKSYARTQLGLPEDEVVIGFFGSIAKNRGIEQLIEARRLIGEVRADTRLLISGANQIGLPLTEPGIDYRGMLPQAELPVLINACDVVVVPYLPDPQVDVSNACKIAEYVACGVPVVTTRVSNFAEIFAATPQAICEPGNARALAEAITLQLRAPQILPFQSRAMTWPALAKSLEREISLLAAGLNGLGRSRLS